MYLQTTTTERIANVTTEGNHPKSQEHGTQGKHIRETNFYFSNGRKMPIHNAGIGPQCTRTDGELPQAGPLDTVCTSMLRWPGIASPMQSAKRQSCENNELHWGACHVCEQGIGFCNFRRLSSYTGGP